MEGDHCDRDSRRDPTLISDPNPSTLGPTSPAGSPHPPTNTGPASSAGSSHLAPPTLVPPPPAIPPNDSRLTLNSPVYNTTPPTFGPTPPTAAPHPPTDLASHDDPSPHSDHHQHQERSKVQYSGRHQGLHSPQDPGPGTNVVGMIDELGRWRSDD